ncbi:transcriptional regulator, LacI family [Palleronia salina]|uniref:Transcriptional regulator, LacI family n=1 Tax=Palleronia salina TaxID=313368 RepID=A0A1M6EZM4_9RHOB|nr:LacI family DNA-binding transcriptional regulator [Palleronia salina]SHI90892.1 transcriptional regulator, LacI family [Palleronia salina]
MNSQVTSLDVARLAGVSQSAVSRVFSGASASAATAQKVRRAAAELGYRPNPWARAMITGRSGIIGLVVAYFDNPFYPVALELLSRALKAEGYRILVFTVGNSPAEIESVMDELTAYRVDGIITASVAMTNDLTDRCAQAGIPIVLFNRGQDGVGLSSVTSANDAGARQVARFLVAGGHQRIAHVAGWQQSSTGRDRLLGFEAGLAEAGTAPVAVIDGLYDRDAARAATLAMMDTATPPDAIFVGNDHMAFAVMDTLRHELGLSVPGDVSVVGFDDVPMAAWPAYDLTTVRQPVRRMVDSTVETLVAQIAEPDRAPQSIRIDAALVLRGSARCPEGWTE